LGELKVSLSEALLIAGELLLIFQAVSVLGFGALGESDGVLIFQVGICVLGGGKFTDR
jgi:hypothetical protein